jgi:hypothetical protein
LHRATNDTALSRALWFAFTDEEAALGSKPVATFVAVEAALVPLSANCGDDNLVHDMLLAAQAAGCGSARVALETPSEAVLFNKGGLGVEGLLRNVSHSYPKIEERKDLETYIAALGAEEVANMPFSAACHNNFSFNGCLAALAAGAEQLVEIEVAVEPWHAGLMVVGFCC